MTLKQKMYLLALVAGLVLVCYAPIMAGFCLVVDRGVTSHAWLLFVVLPCLSFTLMLLLPKWAAGRISILAAESTLWWRSRRLEWLWTVLLSLTVIFVNGALGALLVELGMRRTNPVWHFNRTRLLVVFITVELVLYGPIAEEVFWRGAIQDRLTRVCGPVGALFVQAIAFALCHFRYTGARVQVFAVGMILGLWRWKKKSLIPVIIAHCAVNALVAVPYWQDWEERTRVRPTVDYVVEMNRLSASRLEDPNDNAAPYYARAFALGVGMPDDENFDELKSWPGAWPEDKHMAVKNWIAANDEALELLVRGSRQRWFHRDYRGRDMWGLIPPELAMARDLSLALSTRSLMHACEGNVQQACADVLACCRFGLHFRGPKTTLEQIMGTAISAVAVERGFLVLQGTEPQEGLWDDLQMGSEAILAGTDLRFDFRAERQGLCDALQRVFTDDGRGGGTIVEAEVRQMRNPPTELEFLFDDMNMEAWTGLDRARTVALVEEVFAVADTLQRRSPYQRKIEGIDIQADLEDLTRDNGFVHTLLLNVGRVTTLTYRFQSSLQALVTTLAIQRYQLQHGHPPGDLQALVEEGLLEGLYDDPFGGLPLHYRQTEEGFILYSNGSNCNDDGGVHDKHRGWNGDDDYVFWPVMSE